MRLQREPAAFFTRLPNAEGVHGNPKNQSVTVISCLKCAYRSRSRLASLSIALRVWAVNTEANRARIYALSRAAKGGVHDAESSVAKTGVSLGFGVNGLSKRDRTATLRS